MRSDSIQILPAFFDPKNLIMPTLFDPIQKQKQIDRLKNLRPETIPDWGKLTAVNLLPHLADPMRAGLGEIEVPLKKSFFSTHMGRWLIIYGIKQWPKGAPTSPKFNIEKEGRYGANFENDMAELLMVIERFCDLRAEGKLKTHPAFGNISHKTWGYLMNKHIEHHLRQFRL